MSDPVAAYLATVPPRFHAVCADLDRQLRALLPDAEPVLSYGMPGYKVHGAVIAGWAAHKDFCSYYPHSGSVLADFADEIRGRGQTKSALHFTAADPLPPDLVRRLVERKLRDVEAAAQRKAAKKK